MHIEDTRAFGQAIRKARRHRRMTQRELALVAGTGERFVVDLESGKPTAQLGRALAVLATLGLRLDVLDPQRDTGDAAP
jgi:y4mF family transcriptional regulator